VRLQNVLCTNSAVFTVLIEDSIELLERAALIERAALLSIAMVKYID
jgi:hypothetical protein